MRGGTNDTRGTPRKSQINNQGKGSKKRGEFTPIHGECLGKMDLLGEDGVDPAGEVTPVGGDGLGEAGGGAGEGWRQLGSGGIEW